MQRNALPLLGVSIPLLALYGALAGAGCKDAPAGGDSEVTYKVNCYGPGCGTSSGYGGYSGVGGAGAGHGALPLGTGGIGGTVQVDFSGEHAADVQAWSPLPSSGTGIVSTCFLTPDASDARVLGAVASTGVGGLECGFQATDDNGDLWDAECAGDSCNCMFDKQTVCTCHFTGDSECRVDCCPTPWPQRAIDVLGH